MHLSVANWKALCNMLVVILLQVYKIVLNVSYYPCRVFIANIIKIVNHGFVRHKVYIDSDT